MEIVSSYTKNGVKLIGEGSVVAERRASAGDVMVRGDRANTQGVHDQP